MDKIPASLNDRGTRSDGAIGLDAEDEFSIMECYHRLNERDE